MKTFKISALAITTFLVTSMTPQAIAGDGFFISGGINTTTQQSFSSRNTGSNQPNLGAAGGASATVVDKDTGIGFFGGAGYKTHLTPEFFVAVEGFYSTESADTTTINNVKVNNVELNSTYGGDLRLGTDVTEKVAIYGLASFTAHDFDSALSYTFAPPTDDVSETVWGFTYGGGVEIALSEKLSTFGEFRIANDLDFDTPIDRGGIQTFEELDYTTLRTGIRFSF